MADEPQPTVAEATTTTAPPPIQVVATANFVADWARVVGGERVEVFGLLPAGGDPHSYQPGARDVARVAEADIVFTIGLGLETEWLGDLLHSASADESRIVALGDYVDPIEFADEHDDHDDHDDDHMDHDDHDDDHADHDDHDDDHADHDDHDDDHADHDDHDDDHADHDDHDDDHMDHDDHDDDHADHDDHDDD
ncbi:MAG: zinc ABC transporter substrate-binding protein, partial [Acidimicrobiia bacterium]|nr:zinc ABC transporter substrate-binding protein [Acidimicrobiia bacterium]